MPQSMTAIVQKDRTLFKESIPVPQPAPHQLLVKISHVAQNPTDVKSFDLNLLGDNVVSGCDFAGTVEQVGENVNETRVKKGDVIAGLIWGGETKLLGAFAEYTLADQDICFKIPPSISPAAASTIPLAAATSYLALFSGDSLGIDRNNAKNTPLLIWGGSSSVGLYALQIARLYSFYPIITTCSPRNFSLVKSLGATHVFDYSSPSVVSDIQAAAPNLKYVFDTIGEGASSELASNAITDVEGSALCTVRPGKVGTNKVKKGVRIEDVLVWTAFLKEHRFGDNVYPASQEDHNLASELFNKLPEWLESGRFVPNATKVLKGLDSVKEGFQEFREGKISAYKIVYEL